MPFPDDLRPASFRGAGFQIAVAGVDGLGRRAQVHEYPNRDLPFAEDLGRQTGRFDFDAYVIGTSYAQSRDALISACTAAGPGQLVHPTLGEQTVVCIECSLIETSRDRDMAVFRLGFVQSGENRFPAPSPFTADLLDSQADTSAGQVRDTFAAGFSVSLTPQWVTDSATALLGRAVDSVAKALRDVPKAQGTALASIQRAIDSIASTAATLVTTPATLAAELGAQIRSIVTVAARPLEAIGALEVLALFTEDAVPTGTPSREREALNQAALIALVQRLAGVEAARAAADAALASYAEAVALRDRIAEMLDALIAAAGDAFQDDDLSSLRDLRAEAIRDLTVRAGELARIQDFVPAATVPAVVIAQRLYGDGERADEIVTRNLIPHAGFVPGGEAIEVLSA